MLTSHQLARDMPSLWTAGSMCESFLLLGLPMQRHHPRTCRALSPRLWPARPVIYINASPPRRENGRSLLLGAHLLLFHLFLACLPLSSSFFTSFRFPNSRAGLLYHFPLKEL